MSREWTDAQIVDQARCPHCGSPQGLENFADQLRDNPVFVCDCGGKFEVVRAEMRQVVWLRPVP